MYTEEYLQTRFGQDGTAASDSRIGLSMDGTQSFSIDAWLRLNNFGAKRCILSLNNCFSFGVHGDKPYFTLGNQSVTGKTCALKQGKWHFLSMYYYAARREIGLYVDGDESLITSINSILPPENEGENNFVVGENMNGDLRCIRIYDFPLTQLMMEQNMYQEPVNYVKAYLQFATSAPSDTHNKRDINLIGDVTCTANAAGVCFQNFNYAEINTYDGLNPGGLADAPFSVQGWVYWKPNGTQNLYTVFSNTDSYGQKGLVLTLVHDGGNKERILVSFGTLSQYPNSLEYIGEGLSQRWMNLAVTYEKGTLILYVDGVECTCRTDIIPLPEIIEEHRFIIGAGYNPVEMRGCLYFEGIFRNLDIFDAALKPELINAYMNSLPMEDAPNIVGNFSFLDDVPMNRVNGTFLLWNNTFDITESVRLNKTLTAETIDLDYLPEPFTAEELQRFRMAAVRNEETGELFSYVSTHKKDGTLYFVAHTRQGSYTVMSLSKEMADSEEIIWWTTLVLIVLDGLLDLVACLRIRNTPQLCRFVMHYFVNNPVVRGFFKWGGGVSAVTSGILKLAKYIVAEGRLWELIKLSLEVSFWSILGIIAKFTLRFVSQAAAIAYSLGSLALSVLSHYKNRPSTLILAELFVKTVRFNHNIAGVADAINIRKNESTSYPEPYEWNSLGGVSYPAVYSISRVYRLDKAVPIVVLVNFSYSLREVRDNSGIWIRAKEIRGDLFGTSDELYLDSYRLLAAENRITFSHHAFGTKGIVRQTVSFKWQYSLDHIKWTDTTVTTHTIYSILDYPKAPWGRLDSEMLSLPWTDLLDLLADHVKGITTKTDLASKITEAVNQAFHLTYDTANGKSFYTGYFKNSSGYSMSGFDLDKFLGEDHKKYSFTLNCTDCATLVTSFANLYGCSLSAYRMETPGGTGFKCNPILAIGCEAAGWKRPFYDYFRYHEVTVDLVDTEKTSGTKHKVYDACLKVDGRSTPWTDPSAGETRTAVLPVRMSYSQNESAKIITAANPDSYREHLADNSRVGIEVCTLFSRKPDSNYGRRPIRKVRTNVHAQAYSDAVKEQLHFSEWPWSRMRNIPLRKTPLFFTEQIPEDFCLQRRTGEPGWACGYTELYYERHGNGWLYVTEVLCDSEKEAQELLLGYLSDSASPVPPPRLTDASIDIGFGDNKEGRQIRVFTSGNIFVSIHGYCVTHHFALTPGGAVLS